MSKAILTQSSINRFMGCQRSYYFRMKKGIVPIGRDENMYLGTVVHDALFFIYMGLQSSGKFPEFSEVEKLINKSYPNRYENKIQRKSWHQALAMIKVYMDHYAGDQGTITVLDQEREFEGQIINPRTGRFSRIFKFAGKYDWSFLIRGFANIGERKTASQITPERIQSVWMALQTGLYHLYNPVIKGHKVRGVVYDFLAKYSLVQAEGETDEVYEQRRQVAIAASSTGKTGIKQKIAETDEAVHARMVQKTISSDSFHRESILTTPDREKALMAQLWEIAYLIHDADKRGFYTRNPNHCFKFNKPCEYFPLCSGNESEHLINSLYEYKQPNSELSNNIGEV